MSSLHFLITSTGIAIIFNFPLIKHTHTHARARPRKIITFLSWFSQEDLTAQIMWTLWKQDLGKDQAWWADK